MEFLIITGLSGAGKSRAADVLEDLDFYCVDNMPVALMEKFAEFCVAAGGRYEKVALVTDVRENEDFTALLSTLDSFGRSGYDCRILYMDADVPTIVRRYKESRRPHPLAQDKRSIEDAVRREIRLLAPVRERADYIVNTSGLTLGMLQNRLFSLFAAEGQMRALNITVLSFGYKYGIPLDADLVFDVRFMPNPFYVDELRQQTGLDLPVAEYVFGHRQARLFMEKLEDMIEFLIPMYVEEGKLSLTVAIGCTGGRHRSVAIAHALSNHLKSKGFSSDNIDRDLEK
ncbi:MAG: RNase adapter RapZ [Oscillospiraceae bacterium]|nr:RNase adapter RapZ [Oscillospiraceae bacterium]